MEIQRLIAEIRPFMQRLIKTSAATGCRVIRTSAQSIPSGSLTALSFGSLTDTMTHGGSGVDDTDGCWAIGAPTKLVCVTPGWYMAGGGVGFPATAGAYRHVVVLNLYTSADAALATLAQSENHVAASTSSYISVASGMFYMHTGDYLTVSVYQNTGGNLNTATAALNNHVGANGWLVRVV